MFLATCREVGTVGYLDRRALCEKHWLKFCALRESGGDAEAFERIGLKPRKERAS